MKTRTTLLTLLATCLMLWSCDDEETSCDGQDCSGHGTCVYSPDETPYCACDPGYYAKYENPLACWEEPLNNGRK